MKYLNRGAFGHVYKGVHNDCHVAIKKMNYEKANHSKYYREYDNWCRVSDCKNIVSIKDCSQTRDHIFFYSELCQDLSLQDRLYDMNYTEKHCVMRDIINGIAYCHEKNIIHNDVKPSNIVYGYDNIWKLIDFGSSFHIPDKKSISNRVGTPLFRAPESFFNDYDMKVDVWAYGIVLYIMHESRYPYNIDGISSWDDVFQTIQSTDIIYYKTQLEIQNIIDMCLTIDPSHRASSQDIFRIMQDIK